MIDMNHACLVCTEAPRTHRVLRQVYDKTWEVTDDVEPRPSDRALEPITETHLDGRELTNRDTQVASRWRYGQAEFCATCAVQVAAARNAYAKPVGHVPATPRRRQPRAA